jgi:hypothetical protein
MAPKQIAYFLTKSGVSIRLKITDVIKDPNKITFVAKKVPTDIKPNELKFAGFQDPLVRMDVTNVNYSVISEVDYAGR